MHAGNGRTFVAGRSYGNRRVQRQWMVPGHGEQQRNPMPRFTKPESPTGRLMH